MKKIALFAAFLPLSASACLISDVATSIETVYNTATRQVCEPAPVPQAQQDTGIPAWLGQSLGAVLGAAAGSGVGKGKGNTIATASGAVIGAQIGGRSPTTVSVRPPPGRCAAT